MTQIQKLDERLTAMVSLSKRLEDLPKVASTCRHILGLRILAD
jgi:hypothetical protein